MSISESPPLPSATPPPLDLVGSDVGIGGFAIAENEVKMNEDNLKTGYVQ